MQMPILRNIHGAATQSSMPKDEILCAIHRHNIHITADPIFASKEIKTKTSALPLLETHFYNERNETATELQRQHASYQLFLPLYCGSGADGTANRVLTRNILQPHRDSHPSHPCALVTIVITWPSRP